MAIPEGNAVVHVVGDPASITPVTRHPVDVYFARLGSPKSRDTMASALERTFDTRIVAATSRDLESEVAEHRFREDLYYRINVVRVQVPALRERGRGSKSLQSAALYLAGRATDTWKGTRIPTHEIAVEACRESLRVSVPELDVLRDVNVIPRLRPTSRDLSELFLRKRATPLANDTSCGTGFDPLTDLERIVLDVERVLTSAETKREHPEIGNDVKIMGVRNGERVTLTVGCAFVGRHISSIDDYQKMKLAVREQILALARETTGLDVDAVINAADDADRGEIFLTVTGTSAEGGDDGEVGRGNRTSGLITPYRKMTLEAAAGKNPVTHVGKLYNVLATRIARAATEQVPGVRGAELVLVSSIGHEITDPQVAHVRVAIDATIDISFVRRRIEDIVGRELSGLDMLRDALLAGQVRLF